MPRTVIPRGHVHRHDPDRESYWEGGRVNKRTLANLSKLPQALSGGMAGSSPAAESRLRTCKSPAAIRLERLAWEMRDASVRELV